MINMNIIRILEQDHNEYSWEDNKKQVKAINKYFKLNNLKYTLEMGKEENLFSKNYGKIWWKVNQI